MLTTAPLGAPRRETLAQLLSNVMAFLLSFVVIGGFWLAHHRLLRRVRHTSRGYNLANIGFMLTVVSLNVPPRRWPVTATTTAGR